MNLLADPREDVPTSLSSDTAWCTWLDECVSSMGKKAGVQVWLKAYSNRATAAQNTSALREFAKGYGINISATNIFGSLEDTSKDIVGGIEDGIGGVLNMGKIGVYAVGGTVLLTVILIAVGFMKHPQIVDNLVPKMPILTPQATT